MTQDLLEQVPVVQPFSLVRYLTPDGDVDRTRPSAASIYEGSRPNPGWLEPSLDRGSGSPAPGHAWAARRRVLDEIGLLYDHCVIGGGDAAFLCALTGEVDALIAMQGMGAPQARRYREYAQKVYDPERRRIGYLPGIIDHLWHGALENRTGRERYYALARAGFDPCEDLEVGANARGTGNRTSRSSTRSCETTSRDAPRMRVCATPFRRERPRSGPSPLNSRNGHRGRSGWPVAS